MYKYAIKPFGHSFAIIMQLLMFYIFLKAWLSPDKEITVAINFYGEANIELLIMLAMVVVSIFGYCLTARDEEG